MDLILSEIYFLTLEGGLYSRAFISKIRNLGKLLFEESVYSKRGVYLRKYGTVGSQKKRTLVFLYSNLDLNFPSKAHVIRSKCVQCVPKKFPTSKRELLEKYLT